jgi:hypothetical protein
MKTTVKFTCFDCGRKIEGTPNLVLRQGPYGAWPVRVNVCRRCQTGQKPQKTSELATQHANYVRWMRS